MPSSFSKLAGKNAMNGSGATVISANFTNGVTGTLNINAGKLTLSQSSGNSGAISIASGATLARTGGSYTNAGLITGTGTIDATGITFTNNGTIAPGTAGGAGIGTLTLLGNYHQGAGGVLQMGLGGTGAGQYDVLSVTGTAYLNGTLSTIAVNGYVPLLGDAFNLITYGARSGSFANLFAPSGFSLAPGYSASYGKFTLH